MALSLGHCHNSPERLGCQPYGQWSLHGAELGPLPQVWRAMLALRECERVVCMDGGVGIHTDKTPRSLIRLRGIRPYGFMLPNPYLCQGKTARSIIFHNCIGCYTNTWVRMRKTLKAPKTHCGCYTYGALSRTGHRALQSLLSTLPNHVSYMLDAHNRYYFSHLQGNTATPMCA